MPELNGEPVEPAQLQTLALTNYGHFTSMRVEDGRVRGFSLHIERLRRDCRALFGVDIDAQRVRELVRRAVPPRGPALIRVTLFDPTLDLGRPSAAGDPHVLVTSRPAAGASPPAMRVASVVHMRDMPSIKSVGLFATLHYRRQAQLQGFDDVVFVDRDGRVSEGGTWNIGFFDGNQVIWPDADCLVGVTMTLVKQVHPHEVRTVRLTDLPGMVAAFATNASTGVRAIGAIDNAAMTAVHDVITMLTDKYMDIDSERI